MSITLYELTEGYKNLLKVIEDGNDDEEIVKVLESLDDEIESKADSYAIIMKSLDSDILMLKEEEKRLSDRRKSIESNIKRLKTNLEQSMIALDKKKFKTDKFSFNIQKNPPSLKIIDDLKALEHYSKTVIELDKAKLKEDLKNGLELDFAILESGESLRIK